MLSHRVVLIETQWSPSTSKVDSQTSTLVSSWILVALNYL